jgi:hypothetical protein
VPHHLDRAPRPVAVVGEARGQGEHPGLGHSPRAIVRELRHGQGHSRYPLGQQLALVGPGVDIRPSITADAADEMVRRIEGMNRDRANGRE